MKRVQFPKDFFYTQTWPPIHCFVHKYGRRYVMWKRSIKPVKYMTSHESRKSQFNSTNRKWFILIKCVASSLKPELCLKRKYVTFPILFLDLFLCYQETNDKTVSNSVLDLTPFPNFKRGGSVLKSNSLPFYIPLLPEKVPLSHTSLKICIPFNCS